MSADSLEAVAADVPTTRRRLVVAWRNSTERAIWTVGHLDYADGRYSFTYVQDASQIPDFRPLLEFPEFQRTYVSEELFPFFAQRVMDRRRPDYVDYVESLALTGDASALDVLARSGGRRKGDKVQLAEIPHPGPDGTVAFDFLVHGSRFSPAGEDVVAATLLTARSGDELTLLQEPENTVNPHALLVATTEGIPIGWVPDPLVPLVESVREAGGWRLTALRVNGPEVPWHQRVVAHMIGRLLDDAAPVGKSSRAATGRR